MRTLLSEVVLLLCAGLMTASTKYYISPSGNDAIGDGTIGKPWRTFNKAIPFLYPGDTLYARAGTYDSVVVNTRDGSRTAPIVIRNYPGETAIINGHLVQPYVVSSGLVTIVRKYITMYGLVVDSSYGNGINDLAAHGVFDHMTVRNTRGTGISARGDSSVIVDCVGYNLGLANYNGHQDSIGSGWAGGFSIGPRGTDTVICGAIRRNTVYNSWGEGIDVLGAKYVVCDSNLIYDCYPTNLYICSSWHTHCEGNLIYHTRSMIDYQVHPWLPVGDAAVGLSISNEGNPPSSGWNTCIGNIVYGSFAYSFYLNGPTVNNLVANNTFVGGKFVGTIRFTSDSATMSGNVFVNNIIVQDSSSLAPIYFNHPTSLGNSVLFSHNLWSKTPDTHAAGAGDIVGDVKFARIGNTTAGNLSREYFSLSPGSPAIGAGLPIAIWSTSARPNIGAMQNESLADAPSDDKHPVAFSLEQNYPNPFNPSTNIQFSISEGQFVILKVFDSLGQEVVTLVRETKGPGTYTVPFDGSRFASGMYFYRLQAGPLVQTKKMMLIK